MAEEATIGGEDSHLLGAGTSAAAGYGSQSTEQERLLDMGQTENPSRTFPQYAAALAAAGGALAAGVLLGWTSPAEIRLVEHEEYGFEISKEQFSWVSAAMTLGAASICIPIGFLMNAIGRKLTMLLLVLPFSLGWALLIWAKNVEMMYIARYILGISGGAFCVTAPIYTGEIAQKEIRGSLGSFFQLMITIGILFVYVIGWKLSVFTMSIISGVIPLIFGGVFLFMPESPTYLVSKGKTESAINSIKWLRGNEYNYTDEIAEIKAEDERIRANSVSVGTALLTKTSMKALFISLGLMFFQQLSGINAVIFYTNKIFYYAKTGVDDSIASILVGVMQVIATFVSTLVVDKLGRRILLLASSSVMAICTIFMGVYFYLQDKDERSVENYGWLPIVCLCIFIIMFSIGFGPVPWLMMGELFAADIKSFAGSIAGTSNWLLAFIVTKTFVNLVDCMGIGPTFWLFSSLSILGTVFVFFCVPETKGKSLLEIQRILRGENPSESEPVVTNEAKF